MKKKLLIIFLAITSLMSTGCWSYIGIDEITIVAGLAIDKNEDENYELTYEVINLTSSNKETGLDVELVSSSGSTIFDAIRNARSVASNKLYFSHAQVIIISNEIAETDGINEVINFLIRDAEIRETTKVVVSEDESAASLLDTKGITHNIISFKIMSIVENIEKVNLYSMEVQLYDIINIINAEGMELILPLFKTITMKNEDVVSLSGTATFKGDKLYDYLTPEESKYLLFVINRVEGGILTLSSKEDEKTDLSIEIYTNKTKIDYVYKEDKLKFFVNIKMHGFVGEIKAQDREIDSNDVKKIEKLVAIFLKEKVEQNIKEVLGNGNYDVFNFGHVIYRKDPKLWENLKGDWNEKLSTIEVEVKPEIIIDNAAFLK